MTRLEMVAPVATWPVAADAADVVAVLVVPAVLVVDAAVAAARLVLRVVVVVARVAVAAEVVVRVVLVALADEVAVDRTVRLHSRKPRRPWTWPAVAGLRELRLHQFGVECPALRSGFCDREWIGSHKTSDSHQSGWVHAGRSHHDSQNEAESEELPLESQRNRIA